jgi:hypothetical protein
MGFRRRYFLRLGSGGELVELALGLGSLFAGLEHQSGSVWFARMAWYKSLFSVGGTVLWRVSRWSASRILVGCA